MEFIYITIGFALGVIFHYSISSYRKEKEKREILPKPKQLWKLKGKYGDPFPKKDSLPITILEVKEGWVRYDMKVFKDERMELSSFLQYYSLYKDIEK